MKLTRVQVNGLRFSSDRMVSLMHNTCKIIVGIATIFISLAGAWNAYSQSTALPEPAYLTPMPPTLAPSGGDRLDDLAVEIASLRSELAKKTDKPSGKGWSSPKLGGRFFMDYVSAMNQDRDGWDAASGLNVNAQNWLGVREARLCMTGTGYDFLDYKFEIGFEKNQDYNGTYKDVFLGIQNVPFLEYVRVGHQYVEEGGSEVCNGTSYYTFMEIPAPVGQQFMGRRLGVTSRNLFADDRVRLFFGVYGANNIGDCHYYRDDNQGIVLNSRLTLAPVYCWDGRRLFLFGGYYSFVDSSQSRTLLFSKPGGWDLYRYTGNPGNLGSFFSDRYQKAGLEVVCQAGRFCFQTDLFLQHYADVNNGAGAGIGNQTNYGGFAMARLFLTRNDYRKYSLKSASWEGVDVAHPFRLEQHGDANVMTGCGAWEAAAMYGFYESFASPTDADNRMTNHQIGAALNWYWNSGVKWCVNYFHDLTDARYARNHYHPSGDYLGMSCRVTF